LLDFHQLAYYRAVLDFTQTNRDNGSS
jgi:hypothetical protein